MCLAKLISRSFVFAIVLGLTHVSFAQAADAADVQEEGLRAEP